jgi:hypothetical protein
MIFAILAGMVQGTQEKRLRRCEPERYPPTLLDHIRGLRRKGDLSCVQLLCCKFQKLRSSHYEERTRWHIQKELRELAQHTRMSFANFRMRSVTDLHSQQPSPSSPRPGGRRFSLRAGTRVAVAPADCIAVAKPDTQRHTPDRPAPRRPQPLSTLPPTQPLPPLKQHFFHSIHEASKPPKQSVGFLELSTDGGLNLPDLPRRSLQAAQGTLARSPRVALAHPPLTGRRMQLVPLSDTGARSIGPQTSK